MRRLLAGFQTAKDDVIVGRCLIIIFVFSLLSLPFIGQMPTLADRNLGIAAKSTEYGVLYACFGVGALMGALSIGTVLAGRRLERVVRVGLVVFAGFLAVFSSLRRPELAYPAILLVGLAYFAVDHVAVDRAAAASRRLQPWPGDGALDHGLRWHGPHRQPHRRTPHRGHVGHHGDARRRRGRPRPGCLRRSRGTHRGPPTPPPPTPTDRPASAGGQAFEAGDATALDEDGIAVAEFAEHGDRVVDRGDVLAAVRRPRPPRSGGCRARAHESRSRRDQPRIARRARPSPRGRRCVGSAGRAASDSSAAATDVGLAL